MENFKIREQIADIDYMPSVLGAMYSEESRLSRMLLWVSFLFVVAVILWASFSQIDEITRGEGKVVPSSQVQKINHLEGGIIKEFYVKEGDIVEKNQIILKVDNISAKAKLKEGRELYYRYKATVQRIEAQLNNKPLVFSNDILKNAPDIAKDAEKNYENQRDRLKNAISIAEETVKQKTQEIQEFEVREKEMRNQEKILGQEIELNRQLLQKGLVAKLDVLKQERELSELKANIKSAQSNILKGQAAMGEAQTKKSQVERDFQSQNWEELKDAKNRMINAQGSVTTEGDRIDRTELRSPVRGIVKQLLISTVGSVIQPGQGILEIVPLEDNMLIENQIKPSDVAFLRPGLEASIKVSAYDYSIYGDIKAELIRISADTMTDDKGNSFYKVYLRTWGNKLSKTGKSLPIIPGMTVTSDIKTGKKTVMDYLLKPILKAKSQAMTER
jgi:adhesin transport system membrane fusion protein